MKRWMQVTRSGTVGAALLLVTGCAGANLGTLGEILGAGLPGSQQQQGAVEGEVRQVDQRSQQISIQTRDGRTGQVRYDNRTEVVYRQQRHPVSALEPGDVVSLQVQQDARGNLYTSRIDVLQSVQERGGAGGTSGGQLQVFEGRVGQIDYQRGAFVLQSQYGGSVTVTLPYNPDSSTTDRFRRLRTGDQVRLEGQQVNQGRVELSRFL